MALFNIKTREPRRFNHKFMYVNERKEKLKKIEERAKRDLGIIPEETYNPENLKGTFVKGTKHLRRRKESGRKPMKLGVALLLIAAALFLWYFIKNGNLYF